MIFGQIRKASLKYRGHAMAALALFAVASWYAIPPYILSHSPALATFTQFMAQIVPGLEKLGALVHPAEWLRFWMALNWTMSAMFILFLLFSSSPSKLNSSEAPGSKKVGLMFVGGVVFYLFVFPTAVQSTRLQSIVLSNNPFGPLFIALAQTLILFCIFGPLVFVGYLVCQRLFAMKRS